MTCGIYKLTFPNTDKVYVGQSQNIENRYTQHINSMLNNNTSKKLQDAFRLYGIPTYEILIECNVQELDVNEKEAIEIFDSVNSGFNTLDDARIMPKEFGENHPNAKYTNHSIETAFLLLCDFDYSHKEISNISGVSINMVHHIAAGTCHVWLKDKYPDKYTRLINSKPAAGTLKDRLGTAYKIKSPEGTEYQLDNLRAFSREHCLPYTSLNNLIKGKVKHVRGWTLVK